MFALIYALVAAALVGVGAAFVPFIGPIGAPLPGLIAGVAAYILLVRRVNVRLQRDIGGIQALLMQKNIDGALATQWFIVSDLGLSAYSGNDGVHVFVNSLASTAVNHNVQRVGMRWSNGVNFSRETVASAIAVIGTPPIEPVVSCTPSTPRSKSGWREIVPGGQSPSDAVSRIRCPTPGRASSSSNRAAAASTE